jgi:DNA primase
VMIFLTTTAIEIDEELLNRCLVLTVDEGREQTRAIHAAQRFSKTLEGLLNRAERSDVLAVHRNAQRLLTPLLVANPYAERLTFVDHQTRTRRDHTKYLTLIQTIALLHQHQRPKKRTSRGGKVYEYIEVSVRDIEIANRLAHAILGRSLDELPPQTRRFLLMLDEMASKACAESGIERIHYRFSRRQAREHGGFGYTQTKVHLERLVELEYLGVHRSGRGQDTLYELRYDGRGKDGAPFLMGLIDTAALDAEHARHVYDASIAGQTPSSAAPLRAEIGPSAGPLRSSDSDKNTSADAGLPPHDAPASRNSRSGAHQKTYVLHRSDAAQATR